jgi:hypothetical protein
VGPLAVATAATTIFDGAPATESGRMCMTIKLVEYRAPFGFCNRYVTNTPISADAPPPLAALAANDASSAFAMFDGVKFGRLHVQSVKITLRVQRGLQNAYMTSAKAPRRVHPGQRIPVTLRVRRYRGRTITERLHVRLPTDLKPGRRSLELLGTAPEAASNADLGTILIDALGGSSDQPDTGDPGPPSLRAVIDSVEGLARTDGVSVAFPDLGRRGRAGTPIYLNPKLRISGTVTATLRVVK